VWHARTDAQKSLVLIIQWVRNEGPEVSGPKIKAMLTKGSLVTGFTLSFDKERIVSLGFIKYLEIWLDQRRTFKRYLESFENKSETLFSRLRGIVGANWSIKRENLMVLYRGVFLPKIAYDARFWAHQTCSPDAVKKFGKIQRRALLGITSAYRKPLTDALQVLAASGGTP